MRTAAAVVAASLVLTTAAVRADVRADEKSHVEFAGMLGRMVNMFGGKAAKEGVTSSVAVKGDRKATLNDATGQIIDLSEEKIYDLDLKKKTVRVTTFAELRRRMEEAQKKAADDAKKQQPAEAKPQPTDDKQMEIDFDVKNTGQKKTINGFDTHEVVMTITVRQKGQTLEQGGGLVMTSDMWMAPKIAAMKEISDFDRRYYEKLYGPTIVGASAEQMASAMALYPMLKPAIGKMTTEGAKLDGTPIHTTTTVDSVKSADEIAQEQQQQKQQNSDDAKQAAQGGVGGLAGRFASRMVAKKVSGDDASKARATFMTLNNDVLKVTTDVAATDVAVPQGFKEGK